MTCVINPLTNDVWTILFRVSFHYRFFVNNMPSILNLSLHEISKLPIKILGLEQFLYLKTCNISDLFSGITAPRRDSIKFNRCFCRYDICIYPNKLNGRKILELSSQRIDICYKQNYRQRGTLRNSIVQTL